MTIRPANFTDRSELIRLYLEMLYELEPMGNEMTPTLHNAQTMVDNVLLPAAARGDGVVVAVALGCTVGFCAFARDLVFELRGAVAYGMYVDPAHRRGNVCTRLQTAALQRLAKQGVKTLFGGALRANHAALSAIRKLGAKKTGETFTLNLESLCLGLPE